MRHTYAVTWSKPGGHVYAGRLEFRPEGLMLHGGAGRDTVDEELPYGDLAKVHRGRSIGSHGRGRASLVLELLGGGEISIASVGQPGALNEVAERIASAGAG